MPEAPTEDKALIAGFVATQVGEALANYERADTPLEQHQALVDSSRDDGEYGGLYDDGEFWKERFAEKRTGSTPPPRISFYRAIVSEWVARVPGLFWRPGSAAMRQVTPADRESETRRWITYKPGGKSQLVSGGIGTLRFAATADGFQMVTLTTSQNASTGVPALISPEVWEHHRLAEGALLEGAGQWAPLPHEWAAQFPMTVGVPRGCIVIKNADAMSVVERDAPVQVHPFSVMEHWDGSAMFHDFVYMTVDTGDPDLRRTTTDFFDDYRARNGRGGRYLLAADIADPLWEATFASPAEMRLNKPELSLIETRVTERTRGEQVIEALIRRLARLSSADDLKRLSQDACIQWQRWSKGGRVADEAARLVAEAVALGKQVELLQVVMQELT